MRNSRPGKPCSLAGSLLVAHPNMLDPNFRRAVLFISAHDPDDGAIGVIINRPLDKSVADLVSETPPQNLADVPVFFGGPVGNNQLMLAAFEWHKGEGLKLNQHSPNEDGSVADVADGAPSIFAFLGYAGWSAGQHAQPRGFKIGAAFAALVRHYEPARSVVSDACRRAGRSVAQLSDQ